MKPSRKIIFGFFLLVGLQFGLSSCATEGSGSVETGVYYGPRYRYRDPWFRDDPWVDGHGWYRGNRQPERGGSVDIYLSPPRLPGPPRIRLP
jgi:hypothetical protein